MNTDRLLSIPAGEYHAASRCGRYMSSHNQAAFRESPELYRRKTDGEIAEAESPALALGRAAHCLILEGRAAVLSFAFVFAHPFDDGNGRLHRYLMHHFLNAMGFCPENVIFPVSALLYKNAKLYDGMLESFSRRLLPLVEYRLSADGSMTVENDTVDFYRHIDFTRIVEDFFDAVEQTLKDELIPELDYLARWEKARSLMREIVDMPDKKAAQFILFTQQNNGIFPKARRNMFQELSDEEIASLAKVVKDVLMPVVEQK